MKFCNNKPACKENLDKLREGGFDADLDTNQIDDALRDFNTNLCKDGMTSCDPFQTRRYHIEEQCGVFEDCIVPVAVPGCSGGFDGLFETCMDGTPSTADREAAVGKYERFRRQMKAMRETRSLLQGIAVGRSVEQIFLFVDKEAPWKDLFFYPDFREWSETTQPGRFFSGNWAESACWISEDYTTASGTLLTPQGQQLGTRIDGTMSSTRTLNYETGNPVDVNLYLITLSVTPTGLTKSSHLYLDEPEECEESIKFSIKFYPDGGNDAVMTLPGSTETVTLPCNSETYQQSFVFSREETAQSITKVCLAFENVDDLHPHLVSAIEDNNNELCKEIKAYNSGPGDIGCDETSPLTDVLHGVTEVVTFSLMPSMDCDAYGPDDEDNDGDDDNDGAGGGSGDREENRPDFSGLSAGVGELYSNPDGEEGEEDS